MTLCVYAVVAGRSARVWPRGVAGERLRRISDGAVTAIAGELQRGPTPSAQALRRYDTVIRALALRHPALLPARFGTCFDSPDQLRLALRWRERALREALAHVRSRVQMTVRVLDVPEGPPEGGHAARNTAAARNRATSASRFSRTGPGTAYLRDRAHAAARAREIPGFEPVRDAVRRWVRDERVEKRSGVGSVYHLVPRASAGMYRAAVERAAEAAGLRVVVSGPSPVYAFAEWN